MTDQDDPRGDGAGGRQPAEGDDRRRYFAQSMGTGQSGNRHRRRRAPGDPTTTGSIPIVRVGESLPDPTIEYRTPERPAGEPSPYFQVQYRTSEVEGLSFTEPRTSPSANEPPTVVNPPIRRQPTPPPPPPPAAPERAAPVSAEPTGLFDILDATKEESPAPTAAAPIAETPAPAVAPPAAAEITDPHLPVVEAEPAAATAYAAPPVEPPIDDGDDEIADRPMPRRKRNRKVLIAVLALVVVAVLVVGGIALKMLGVFESSTDYDSTTGHGSALVHVENDSSIRDIGDALTDAGVVGSRKAFVNATGNDTVAAGFYKLPKGISAAAAVSKMQGNENRVGRVVIPDGRQLDSKKGADDHTTPGIFQLIADSTSVKTDDESYGVTVDQLAEAAKTASADDLGVPSWARETFNKLGQDHRRVEGLIASGTWENVDPRENATEILRSLITDSAKRFSAWGIETDGNTGFTAYQTLVTASIVEREVREPNDFPKVARVILNRLKADQRLEMDSTANYTADVQNIDLGGAAYKDANAWNTYQHKGLPLTPIGAVGERALTATINPADGDWLYFVTVDKNGKTLFSKSFEQHKKNRLVACRNKLLVTGC